jgi:chromate reductase
MAEKIAAAEAVYISTPEYNFSISSALKNVLDWLSRVNGNPFSNKPVAIASVSAGGRGGLRA